MAIRPIIAIRDQRLALGTAGQDHCDLALLERGWVDASVHDIKSTPMEPSKWASALNCNYAARGQDYDSGHTYTGVQSRCGRQTHVFAAHQVVGLFINLRARKPLLDVARFDKAQLELVCRVEAHPPVCHSH